MINNDQQPPVTTRHEKTATPKGGGFFRSRMRANLTQDTDSETLM